MEISFSKLKKLDVISVSDGKNLGRFCDVNFTLPDGKIKSFVASGGKGFKFCKQDIIVPLADIVKVGEDAVLVKTGAKPPKPPCSNKHDRDCQPDCPPPFNPCAPCNPPRDERRNFDDYE